MPHPALGLLSPQTPRKGTETAMPHSAAGMPPALLSPQTPRKGTETYSMGDIPRKPQLQLSPQTPRKGTETINFFLSHQHFYCCCSFTPNTPQGDGNQEAVVLSVTHFEPFTPNTPQGDGNRERHHLSTRMLDSHRLSPQTPRKGTETSLLNLLRYIG